MTSTFDHPELVKLGYCDLIEEIIVGEDKVRPVLRWLGRFNRHCSWKVPLLGPVLGKSQMALQKFS